MNKYAFFGLIVLWLILATYIIAAVNNFDASGMVVSGAINSGDVVAGGFLSQINGLLNIFWSIFSLQVTGMPDIIIIIFFDIPVIIVGYMIIDIIKDLIPLT